MWPFHTVKGAFFKKWFLHIRTFFHILNESKIRDRTMLSNNKIDHDEIYKIKRRRRGTF